MDFRRKNIFEAIKNMRISDINNSKREKLTDSPLTGVERLKRVSTKYVVFTTANLTPDQRLERISDWFDFSTTEGLRLLHNEYEYINSKETELKNFESQLNKHNIKFNEDIFNALCTGDDIDLASEELKPKYTSTPQRRRRRQVKSTKTVKARATPTATQAFPERPAYIENLLKTHEGDMVPIGPNGTSVSKESLKAINWSTTVATVTRKLLMIIFDRETLASHTLSGKPSPAFLGCNKPTKKQLDEIKIKDLTYALTNSLKMTEKDVRQAITTKCADENKMWRQRMQKLQSKSKENKIRTQLKG